MTKLRHSGGDAFVDKAPSSSPKKFTVTLRWQDGTRARHRTIAFGLKSKTDAANDFPHHRDPQRKADYIERHQKREDWTDPQTRGFWSRWFLWSAPTLAGITEVLQEHLGPKWTLHVSDAAAHQLSSPYT